MSTYPIRGINGCEPDKLSTNILNMNAGSVCEFYGTDRLDFPSITSIDLTANGLNGLDTGTVSNGPIYVYAIKNYTTGVYGWVASPSITQGGVIYPTGFQFMRKMPFGFVYNTAWDGIPNFHLTHWPMPQIRLTDSESSGLYVGLGAGNAVTWTDIDLSYWIPDDARLAILKCETRYPSGSAGSTYIRTYGGQPTGLLVGSVGPSCTSQNTTEFIRITSTRHMQYQVTGGARLYIYILGYCMTEPT